MKMSMFKHDPVLFVQKLEKLTCLQLQKIAKSMFMTKFYNKRKTDLIFQIVEHITKSPHFFEMTSKKLKKGWTGTNTIEHNTFNLYENVVNTHSGYFTKTKLVDIEDSILIDTIINALQTNAKSQEASFNFKFPNCPDNSKDEQIIYGRSEAGCKPGWVLRKKPGECGFCEELDTNLLYIKADDIETNGTYTSAEENNSIISMMKKDQDKTERYVDEVHSSIVERVQNGKKISASVQKQWLAMYVRNVQERMVTSLETLFEDALTVYDVDRCTDDVFEKEVAKQLRNKETWYEWLKRQLIKGVNVIGYLFKILFKVIMGMLKGIGRVITGAWTMAKAFAHVFVFHPRQLRIILFIVRRQQKRMCKWFGEYLVKERWFEQNLTRTKQKEDSLIDNLVDFAQGTGALDPARIKHAILTSPVIEKATANAGKYASDIVSGFLGSIPFGGGFGAIAGIVVDMTTETLSEAAKIELEAQMWSDDFKNNFENFIAIVNPLECIRQMPEVKYRMKTITEGTTVRNYIDI